MPKTLNTLTPARSSLYTFYYNPSVKASLGLVLSVLVSGLLIVLAIKPTLTTIVSLKKQLKDESQVLSLINQKVNALEMAEASYNQNQPYFDQLDKALPKEPKTDYFALQLTYLAQKHNLQLTTVGFETFDLVNNVSMATKIPAEVNIIPFNAGLSGDWSNTKNFLEDLEKLDRLVDVKEISQTANKEPNSPIVTTLKGEIYYLPLKDYL
jgi:Tfp pilus assembly protein PilO